MGGRAQHESCVTAAPRRLPVTPLPRPEYKQVTKNQYDKFAQQAASGLDIAAIEKDLADLTAKAKPSRDYTNKILAHRQHTAVINLK